MRALVLVDPGETPHLEVQAVPDPVPGPGQVVLRVLACGLCHHDVLVMRGTLRRGVKPQVVLGHEIAGEVVAAGPGVADIRIGDRVATLQTNACGHCDRCQTGRHHRCRVGTGIGHTVDGGLAEYVAVSAHSVAPVPHGMAPEEACLLGCPIGVALKGVRDAARVRAGETALVTGATGGLGVHAVQVAAAIGARVFAVTTSAEKLERLEALPGVEQAILHGDVDFAELARAMTEDEGVDAVVDTVGSPLFRSCLASLAQYGRLVLLGEVGGERVPLSLAELVFRDALIMGSSGADREHILEAARLASEGKVRPVVFRKLALDQVVEGYHLLRERRAFGRLVVMGL
ncbi:MAG: alcohol dehydrogenase catalytic domain-containing protein [Chloroflexi bacterium]|nr:alcohol dehydrogenase catalytic domain-containing protein [Chloroflexota bacterium]